MKFDHSKELLDPMGNAIQDGDKHMTLGGAVLIACMSQIEGDQDMTMPDKVEVYRIATKASSDDLDLTPDQARIVQTRCAAIFSHIVFGAIVEAMGGDLFS